MHREVKPLSNKMGTCKCDEEWHGFAEMFFSFLDDHADLSFVNATTHQSTSSGERVVRRYPLKRETSPREIIDVNAGSDALTSN